MGEGARLMGRNGEIWRAYCRGTTMEALAERFKLSLARVSQVIDQVADSIPQQERARLIAQEVDFFRQTRAEIMELWDAQAAPVTAGKDGSIVRDPDGGAVVRDHTGRLNAARLAEQYSARMHRLLGLDAPIKVDLGQEEEDAARRAAAEASTYLRGGEPDANDPT